MSTTEHTFLPTVTAIDNDNLDGVTRIAVVLQGVPHTAQRVDDVELHTSKETLRALDIDGIDFKRYFQWEDEGTISTEIDFPKRVNLKPTDRIVFITVYGSYETAIGRAAEKRK